MTPDNIAVTNEDLANLKDGAAAIGTGEFGVVENTTSANLIIGCAVMLGKFIRSPHPTVNSVPPHVAIFLLPEFGGAPSPSWLLTLSSDTLQPEGNGGLFWLTVPPGRWRFMVFNNANRALPATGNYLRWVAKP